MNDTRKMTKKVIEAIDEGILDPNTIVLACLNYMSEDEVTDMCRANDFFMYEDDEEE